MGPTLDPLDRPVGRLLRLAQVADPQKVVETLSMTVAELGGADVVLSSSTTTTPGSSRTPRCCRTATGPRS